MAEVLNRIKNTTLGNWERIRRAPISAGFVDDAHNCYGRSESLNLDSRPQDTILLRSQYP